MMPLDSEKSQPCGGGAHVVDLSLGNDLLRLRSPVSVACFFRRAFPYGHWASPKSIAVLRQREWNHVAPDSK
jgi:hypothetical protein